MPRLSARKVTNGCAGVDVEPAVIQRLGEAGGRVDAWPLARDLQVTPDARSRLTSHGGVAGGVASQRSCSPGPLAGGSLHTSGGIGGAPALHRMRRVGAARPAQRGAIRGPRYMI